MIGSDVTDWAIVDTAGRECTSWLEKIIFLLMYNRGSIIANIGLCVS